mmetsp:Transcript_50027/g.50386  ORF Transcript_50027/g.50386 Transcript_50027/m.50386 type:complete len:105 (+) Transcript_50027:347-661(+)
MLALPGSCPPMVDHTKAVDPYVNLNETSHQSTDTHVQLTYSLPDDDPKKFSARTPKQLASVYLQLWDQLHGINGGAVTSQRIKKDVDRVIDETLMRIFSLMDVW